MFFDMTTTDESREVAESDLICAYCGESTKDRSALSYLRITGERLEEWGGPAEPTAVLHMGPTGFVHAHGWHMYPPSEDRLSRHLVRAIRSRLPARVLRAESAVRIRLRELHGSAVRCP